MSLAPGQLINPNDSLTCCGATPGNCFYATDAKSCPAGYNPQYCCMPDGSVTSAVFMPGVEPYCPTMGALRTSDVKQCSTPAKHCCYNSRCYRSKNYVGSTCFNHANQPAGQVVDSCSKCPNHVTCCNAQDAFNVCYHQPMCNPGDVQVANCGQCPLPVIAPYNFFSHNKNWMK